MFTNLCKNRPNNILCNALVSNATHPLDFTDSSVPAVNGVKMTEPADFKGRYYSHGPVNNLKIVPRTLNDIMSKSGIDRFDFISLDVEGHELNVLDSFSFEIPTVVWLIETLQNKDEITKIMDTNGFDWIADTQSDSVFVNRKYKKCFPEL